MWLEGGFWGPCDTGSTGTCIQVVYLLLASRPTSACRCVTKWAALCRRQCADFPPAIFLPLNGKNSWKRKKGSCPCWCPGEPGVRGMGWSGHHGSAGSACPSSMPRACGCALRVGINSLGGKFKILVFDAAPFYHGHRRVPGKGHRGVGTRLTAGSAPWGTFSIFIQDKYQQERAWADG